VFGLEFGQTVPEVPDTVRNAGYLASLEFVQVSGFG
jgi:hypothetical protein